MAHESVAARLLPIVYAELRDLASNYLRSDPGHTLQPTALVHEAYLKMANHGGDWIGQNHFIATAATAMRQILVDHARQKNTQKRGAGGKRAELSVELMPDRESEGMSREMRVLELDELLRKLARVDARAGRVAELRLFGGMEQKQIAEVLDVSRTTVVNDWSFARAWLISQAQPTEAGS